jgi:hypothetical protein
MKKRKDGNPRKDVKPTPGATFKKKYIFFEYLPYWKELDIRHTINGMHVQKNVFGILIGTFLDIKMTQSMHGLGILSIKNNFTLFYKKIGSTISR